MIWKPNVTVAAVVEEEGSFLLVEERESPGAMTLFNQPAGHLEAGESLIHAVIRETLEETGYTFVPEWLLGVYHWHSTNNDTTYLRFAFSGCVTDFDQDYVREACIVNADWHDMPQIEALTMRHRSPLVNQCIQDFCAGKRYPLEVLTHYN
ncbi:NUDIX hydrolase [Nitrosomonas aestuarii]|uniref:Phosphatase NudJ n=1 Tax=Nitrosomonas aestuarii TaxID=52441 RepID=A0A1I4E4F6_9PROT|nr:NUDIX hydrolase [Nitrosomonas aestuarii]PTN12322.1 NUDIX domain-containing protein [Nitrosomonas aestuarii]SFL00133.1 NUDIX domain-containing protein [Nitrosomonas aestuarii]